MSGKHKDVTALVFKGFYSVYNSLGYRFLEKIYNNAMELELRELGLSVVQEKPISVFYKNQLMGEYFADLVVNEAIIIELKAVKQLAEEHETQLLNYSKSTPYEVGLLLNFGPKAEIVRKSYDNYRKGNLSWTKSNK